MSGSNREAGCACVLLPNREIRNRGLASTATKRGCEALFCPAAFSGATTDMSAARDYAFKYTIRP